MNTPSEEAIENSQTLHILHQQLLELDHEIESMRKELDEALGQASDVAAEIGHFHQQQVERDERIDSMRQRLENAIAEAGAAAAETNQ